MQTVTTNDLNTLRLYRDAAIRVASNMVGEQAADDVVQEAMLAITTKVQRDGVDPELNWEALLIRYTQWAALDWLKHQKELEHFEGTEYIEDSDSAGPDADLTQYEDRSTPAWPTAIERDTPEHIVTAADLRDLVREIAVAAHGARDYAIFMAHAEDGKSQAELAAEFKLSQQAVSRIILVVRTTLAMELARLGYNVG